MLPNILCNPRSFVSTSTSLGMKVDQGKKSQLRIEYAACYAVACPFWGLETKLSCNIFKKRAHAVVRPLQLVQLMAHAWSDGRSVTGLGVFVINGLGNKLADAKELFRVHLPQDLD